MDLTSAFRNEVFRPLMTLAVPGAVAAGPYALLVRSYNPEVSAFMQRHVLLGLIMLAVGSLAAGFLIENIGSRIEVWMDQSRRDKEERQAIWQKYLALSFQIEPVGQRYLRAILLRLKFELHFSIALLVALAGWIWLQAVAPLLSAGGLASLILLSIAGVIYLLWEARTSAEVLHSTRQTLVQHYYAGSRQSDDGAQGPKSDPGGVA